MKLEQFREEKKEKVVIDKILRVLIIGLLVMILIMMIDAVGTLAQIHEREYGEWPESWILKPIAEWYEDAIPGGDDDSEGES